MATKHHIWSLLELIAMFILAALSMAIYAIWIGQDMNWDLKNYHLVNPYNFIHGKSFSNIATAGMQSWFNPIPNIPAYFLIKQLPPIKAGAIIGALSGINIFLIYIITKTLIRANETPRHIAISVIVISIIFSLSSPIFLSMIGTTFIDNLCSIFILGAISLIISDYAGDNLKYFFASILLGAAISFKLTNAFYAVSFIITYAILCHKIDVKFKNIIYILFGSIIGFLAAGGYWYIQLWQAYGNPIFPLYNNIFQSPFSVSSVDFKDLRFLPRSLMDAITYPFLWFIGNSPTTEIYFRDARFALVFLLLLGFIAMALLKRLRLKRHIASTKDSTLIFNSHGFYFILIFFISAYALWLSNFAIHRYIVGLELLSGIIIIMLLDRILSNQNLKVLVGAIVCAFCVIWGRPADWGRVAYEHDWFKVDLENTVKENTLFVMFIGSDPIGYIVPFFPPTTQFVALESSMPIVYDNAFGRSVQSIISSHTGPIRTLSTSTLSQNQIIKIRQFNLAPAAENDCYPFKSRIDRFKSCGLIKIADASSQEPANEQQTFLLKYELGKVIKFIDSGVGPDFFLYGWSKPEEWGTWTKEKEAAIGLRLSRRPLNDLMMTISAHAFVNEAHFEQDVYIIVNEVELAHEKFIAQQSMEDNKLDRTINVTIPLKLVKNGAEDIVIKIKLPDAISPKDLSLGDDDRRLGLGFTSLRISEK